MVVIIEFFVICKRVDFGFVVENWWNVDFDVVDEFGEYLMMVRLFWYEY